MEHLLEKAEKVTNIKGMKTLYEITKQISGKRSKPTAQLQEENSEFYKTVGEIIKRWTLQADIQKR